MHTYIVSDSFITYDYSYTLHIHHTSKNLSVLYLIKLQHLWQFDFNAPLTKLIYILTCLLIYSE